MLQLDALDADRIGRFGIERGQRLIFGNPGTLDLVADGDIPPAG